MLLLSFTDVSRAMLASAVCDVAWCLSVCLSVRLSLAGIVTFPVSRRQHEMYIGYACLCVCVYPSLHSHTTAGTRM